MSWWVMEQVSVNEAGTQTLANIQCDNVSDLPAPNQSATLGYIIVRGSQAKVLATSENYILGSTGTWVKMEDGVKLDLAGYATEQYVDNGLADKVDTSVYSSGQAAQDAEIAYSISTGVKNLLAYNGYGTGAENGVTYTINTDGTITVNGMPQGSSPSYIELKLNGNAANIARFCDGHHILSGCPVGGSDTTYRMYAARSAYSRFDYGDGVLLTDTTLTDVRLVVYIANGYTANNLVFKPMIRRAEITDDTFQSYAPTNRELYEMILALQ